MEGAPAPSSQPESAPVPGDGEGPAPISAPEVALAQPPAAPTADSPPATPEPTPEDGAPAGAGGLRLDAGASGLSRKELRAIRERQRQGFFGRHRWWIPVVVGLVVLLAAGVLSGFRLSGPPATAVITTTHRPAALKVGGTPPTLPWPHSGQAAMSIPALGVVASSGPEHPVPIASLTKVMTIYVLLRDHPLAVGQSGPTFTITPTQVATYNHDVAQDESSIQVVPGERLTELQLLEGALIRSAANYVDILVRWDAGSVPAFVAKMNATAKALGMDHTHYADVTGFANGSQSTATDQLIIGARAMALPLFAHIVDMPTVTLPVAGTLDSYTPMTGNGVVVGVKSGFTNTAGGCDMLAIRHQVAATSVGGQLVGQRSVLVLAVVTGQEVANVLVVAAHQALAVALVAAGAIKTVPVLRGGQTVATVSVGAHRVPAVTTRQAAVIAWPAQRVSVTHEPWRHLAGGARRGALVTSEVVTLGSQRLVVPVRLTRRIPRISLVQRLL